MTLQSTSWVRGQKLGVMDSGLGLGLGLGLQLRLRLRLGLRLGPCSSINSVTAVPPSSILTKGNSG